MPADRFSRRRSLAVWRWPIAGALLAWCAWLVLDAAPQIATALGLASPAPLTIAALATMSGSWMVFEAWRLLVATMAGTPIPRLASAHVYFTGQIFKYLPGRFWGIGYQAFAGATIAPARAWLTATAVHTGLAIVALIAGAGLIVAFSAQPAWVVPALAGLVVAYLAAWAALTHAKTGRWMEALGSSRLPVLREVMPQLLATFPVRLRIGGLLGSGTLLGFVAWIPLCGATPWDLGVGDSLALAAAYSVAWLAGFFAVLTPAGLGVRELVFLALTPQFSAEVVATIAILARVNLLVADIVLAATFAAVRPARN